MTTLLHPQAHSLIDRLDRQCESSRGGLLQVKEKKSELAKLETTDMGKPIQEAEWDMVSDRSLLLVLSLLMHGAGAVGAKRLEIPSHWHVSPMHLHLSQPQMQHPTLVTAALLPV